ncbi:MAG TPA: flagellar biosynthetic protein FliO [Bryobacteraceae bacterium]|jgi:flagellar biosynthetic protein FliO|nr:flagellar biosynthetic protein FliO [Bryobacteraceae bacterium]
MEEIQQALVVVFVLGLLGGTLYWLRGQGWAKFNGKTIGRGGARRMQIVERLPLGPQHSLHLVNVSGRVLLVAVSPGGCSLLDGEVRLEDRPVER